MFFMFTFFNLTIRKQVLLLLSPLVLLVFFYSLTALRQHNQEKEEAFAQLRVINTTNKIRLTIHELQKERGRTASFLGISDEASTQNLVKQRESASKQTSTLAKDLENISTFKELVNLKELVRKIEDNLKIIEPTRKRVDEKTIQAPEAIKFYNDLIQSLMVFEEKMFSSINNSELKKIIYVVLALEFIKESSGQERAIGSNQLKKKSFDLDMFIKLKHLGYKISEEMNRIESTIDILLKSDFEKLKNNSKIEHMSDLRKKVYKNVQKNGLGDVASDYWFESATQAIDCIHQYNDKMAKKADQMRPFTELCQITKMG